MSENSRQPFRGSAALRRNSPFLFRSCDPYEIQEQMGAPVKSGPPAVPYGELKQVSEFDEGVLAVMHEPSSELFLSSLHPEGQLFENPVHVPLAREHHRNLQEALEAHGIKVVLVRDVLVEAATFRPGFRTILEEAAKDALTYEFHGDAKLLSEEKSYFLSSEYKLQLLRDMSENELVNMLLLEPSVLLEESAENARFRVLSVKTHPLGNLIYTRDQQIVTARGLTLGRLATPQRALEINVMRLVWKALDVPVLAEVPQNATLEGGDFLAHSDDLCFLGIGLRTNQEAAQFLMANDLLGTRRVVLVFDELDKSQARMHLDTVFNIVDPHTVLLYEAAFGSDAPLRRTAHEYVRRESSTGAVRYEHTHTSEFGHYLKEVGFKVISVPETLQHGYAVNFVSTGHEDGLLLAVHPGLPDLLREAGCNVPVEVVELSGVTRMYGAAHCATQILRKPPLAASDK